MIYTIVNDHGDVRVISLLADVIQFNNYEEIFGKVKNHISDEAYQIVLDMEKVQFMDSLSLGMLVPLLLYAKRLGGSLRIAQLNPNIYKLLNTLQLDKIISIYDSVDEAVKSF
ncbi:MAG: STAS domain-containing protein [bacterium]